MYSSLFLTGGTSVTTNQFLCLSFFLFFSSVFFFFFFFFCIVFFFFFFFFFVAVTVLVIKLYFYPLGPSVQCVCGMW